MLVGSTFGALLRETYANSALSGKPTSSEVINSDLKVSFQNHGSTALSGTLKYPISSGFYAFDCSFSGGQLVFVWVADHLVCHTNPPFGHCASDCKGPSSCMDGSISNPLRASPNNARLPLLVHV